MASEHPLHPEYPEFDTEHAANRDTDRNTERNTERNTNRDTSCDTDCDTDCDTSCDTDCDTDLESDTTIGDDREEEGIEEAILALLAYKEKEKESQLFHTGLRGRDYVQELLNCGNQRRCFEVLRMSLSTFQALVNWLNLNTALKSSRTQAGALIEEKVMIFLYIISRGASNRDTAERFSHSSR